jgi:hypothetical protein
MAEVADDVSMEARQQRDAADERTSVSLVESPGGTAALGGGGGGTPTVVAAALPGMLQSIG